MTNQQDKFNFFLHKGCESPVNVNQDAMFMIIDNYGCS